MGTKFTQLKTDLSQNNWLVFVVFLMYKLSSFFRRIVSFRHFVGRRKNYLISSFILVFTCVFHLCGLVFS